jgi:hypothetical protein
MMDRISLTHFRRTANLGMSGSSFSETAKHSLGDLLASLGLQLSERFVSVHGEGLGHFCRFAT